MGFTRALYYPTIDIQNENWLKTAILFWDEINTIVPESIREPYQLDSTKYLADEEAKIISQIDTFIKRVDELKKQIDYAYKNSLKSKTDLNDDQISLLDEGEGWAIVYSNQKKKQKKGPEVCFTGLSASEKIALEEISKANGLHVATSVTKNLMILVAGESAGPSKLKKAVDQGVSIMSKEDFLTFLETGEIKV